MKKPLFFLLYVFLCLPGRAQNPAPRFSVLVLYENGGHHIDYSRAARSWLNRLAADSNFSIDYINTPDTLDDTFLEKYRLFIQLDYPPYGWKATAAAAFERYMEQGKGGWIGFHHAGLLGEFDGYPTWQWFSDFMGGIRFTNYIPTFADGKVNVEDRKHPVMKGLGAGFVINKEEWYTWNKSPRPGVQVIASVDESSYAPSSTIKMGDHPVIWTNTRFPGRNVYIFMGHSPDLFNNTSYTTLFRNALFWAAGNIHPVLYANQVAYNADAPKTAVLQTDAPLGEPLSFHLTDSSSHIVFTATAAAATQVPGWQPGKFFYQLDFSSFRMEGRYRVAIEVDGKQVRSETFRIGKNALATLTIPSIIYYYHQQRANTPQEQAADRHVILFGSNKTADVQGGWCDASGDISKYFSHLSYTNTMMPQQIPLVTWSLINSSEALPQGLNQYQLKTAIDSESAWGADYILRSLSAEGYFYMTVFSYFNPDPRARRIVGLLANSVTTSNYQCAFREGGGMAIAALARAGAHRLNGAFTSQQYLDGARRAFAHLLVNNKKYDDDGKENIIDDYCALMAATELWIAGGENSYRDEARKRAASLCHRMSPAGYFIADDSGKPFWHASDAGLPVVALLRYLDKEKDPQYRSAPLQTIRRALAWNLRVTHDTANPFGYARQSFLYRDTIRSGFFIPHENESGWWWQGENARLASLATAALAGSKIAYHLPEDKKTIDSLATFASQQLSWILGCNPYSTCFMYGFGKNNVPYMASMFGHGSQKGGISNGITGREGNPDGSGIDYREKDNGNEWRWTEQWLPHAAWFLQAVTELAKP